MTNTLASTFAIGDIAVRQLDGLFSLNDLHKASGGESKHQPGKFTALDSTKALIAEIGNSPESESLRITTGRNGGTYGCREVVIAYAAWISAVFHLKVIRVFLNAIAPSALPDHITPAQCQHLSELVDLVVESGRQKTHAETWARFHRKMKVNKYALLKPEHFDAACDYLRGKLDDTSIAAIAQKHFPQVAALAAPTQQTNTMTTIEAPSLANRRWLVYFDHTGREHHQAVPNDAVVLSPKELPEMLRNGVFPAQAVMEIAYAVNMHQFQISCSNPRRGYGEDVVKKIKSGIDDADLYAITVAATMETLMRTTPPLQAVAA